MRDEQHFWARISKPVLLFLALMILTIIGFRITEDWSALQGYYAFIRTAFGDWFDTVVPLTTSGKLFATFINIIAIIAAGYFFAALTSLFVEGQLKNIIKFKKMDKTIADLNDHFIICGIDNVSKHIVEEFTKTKIPFVVVDSNREACEVLLKAHEGLLYIDSDPTQDEVLKEAGVENAKGLIASLGTDHDNVYAVITARNLNQNLKIIAEVIDPKAKDKMIRAGANETVSPNHIGGLRIASVSIRPTVVTFLDTLLRGTATTRFEEVVLSSGSKLVGKKFQEAQEAEETGLSVIAIKKKGSDEFICNPRADVMMESGDILVTLGELSQKDAFEKQYN